MQPRRSSRWSGPTICWNRPAARSSFTTFWIYPRPISYVHVPLVLAPDGNRLAKRYGAVSLPDRLARGETTAQVLTLLASTVGLWCAGRAGDRPNRYWNGSTRHGWLGAAPLGPTTLDEGFLN